MTRIRSLVFLAGGIALLVHFAGLPIVMRSPPPDKTPTPQLELPRPVEADNRELEHLRQAWIKELHQADPDTNWQEIERQNWREHLDRRNRLLKVLKNGEIDSIAGTWAEVGSTNLAGRTHQVAYDETTDTIYLGSNCGGVWQGRFDAGDPDMDAMDWRPISDGVLGGSRQLQLFNSSPPVLLKTGGASFGHAEVYRSTDGGAKWALVPEVIGWPRRLIKTNDPGQTTFLLTEDSGSLLYRSRDQGATFELVREFDRRQADMWTPRTTEGALYLLNGNQLEISTDYGDSWTMKGAIEADPNAYATLAGSEAGAPCLYAIVRTPDGNSSWTLFRSLDAGMSWTELIGIDDFWIDRTSLAASTIDPDLVVYGGVEGYRSTDGGGTFERINRWWDYYGNPAERLHADLPAIDFVPLANGGEILFISTDGGTYFSTDGGVSVHNISLNGLRVSQYYSILTDRDHPDRILAGSQDQGLQFGDCVTGEFDQLVSGDYAYLTSATGTHELAYTVYPRTVGHTGFVRAIERDASGGVQFVSGRIYLPDVDSAIYVPILADPDDGNRFFACARYIYQFDRVDHSSWTPIQLPFDFKSNGWEHVLSMEIVQTTPRTWYAGTNRGRVLYSTDSGQTWSASSFTGFDEPPDYFSVNDIHVDPTRPTEVYIAGSGYSNPGVFRSTDGGRTFEAFTTGLPQTTVFALASDFSISRDLYAATSSGPFRYDHSDGAWNDLLGLVAPFTRYRDLEVLSDRVRFATYGRGIWDFFPDSLQTTRTPGGRRSP